MAFNRFETKPIRFGLNLFENFVGHLKETLDEIPK
jgi:hypothetical protein